MADLDPIGLSEQERDDESGSASDERQQIVLDACCARHALEELPSVENSDPVEKHDQTRETDRADDRRFRRKGTDGKADEQNRADAERKAAQVDLADEISDADREKHGEDRLRTEDVLRKLNHDEVSQPRIVNSWISARGTPRPETVQQRA